ncbi:MAG: restriction endonuclease [Treponema sp. CETP13]|nr:MAG: restriction endonuclease [Treponema sp. CETP13]
MTGQDLKNSILQLAIQGKLVEQREEEGTAKELLEKIKAAKEQLIEEKKIKRQKELPEITEDKIPFEIPESWEWTRISNIADMYTGKSIPKSVKENKYSKVIEGYDYIGTKDVGFDHTVDYCNGIKIPFEEDKFRNSYKNSILMCIEGGSAGRKIGILDKTVCFGNKLCSFNLIYGEPRFLYYYLQNPMFFLAFRDEMAGIIGGVSITKLKSIVIPLPPLEEQKRIVAKIEELMPYVEKYDKANTEVEALNKKFPEDMQKSILQYAIQGKLVEQLEEEGTAEELYKQIQEEKARLIKEGKIKKPKKLPEITEDEIPFEIPENWKWVRLGEVFHIIMGQSPKGSNVFEDNEGIEFHQGKVFFGADYLKGSNKSTNKPTKIVEPNTVLLCVRAPVGIVNITKRKICIGRGLCGINTLADMDERFVLFILRAFKNDFIKKATGTTFVAVTGEVVKNQLFPLPPLAEQKRIVAKIEELLPYTKQLVK